MPSVLSLKEIRSSSNLKDEISKLESKVDELQKQADYQKKVETKLREDVIAHKKDFDHLEKQFGHFAGLEADYDELQSQLQMERLEKLIGSDKVEDKSTDELDKLKAEQKKTLSELKELKKLDPQRLKRQLTDLKKKSAAQASDNQSINKALVSARKDLKEANNSKEEVSNELESRQKGTDFFWQSQDEAWVLYETSQLTKGEEPKDKSLNKRIQCMNTETGTQYLSKEINDDGLAIWLGDAQDIPDEASKEAGKRHKKIAADDEK